MRRRRPLTTLSLSFLDAICCGFGALVLLFLILSHNTVAQRREVNEALLREAEALERQVLSGREQAAGLSADLEQAGARSQRRRDTRMSATGNAMAKPARRARATSWTVSHAPWRRAGRLRSMSPRSIRPAAHPGSPPARAAGGPPWTRW